MYLHAVNYYRKRLLTEWLVKERNAPAQLFRLVHATLNPTQVVRVYGTRGQIALVHEPAAPLFGREVSDVRRAVYTQRARLYDFVEPSKGGKRVVSQVEEFVGRVQKPLMEYRQTEYCKRDGQRNNNTECPQCVRPGCH